MKQPGHAAFTTLKSIGFILMIQEATHYIGGHIDQVWVRNLGGVSNIKLYSLCYNCKDHDALLFTHLVEGDEGKH